MINLMRLAAMSFALMMPLLGQPLGAVEVSAQETTTITIHVRFCPENVTITNHYDQCHDNPFVHAHAFFLEGDNLYLNQWLEPESGDFSFADVSFVTGTGDVVCDWYQTPRVYRDSVTALAPGETTTITIHYRRCPGTVPVTDYFAQCHNTLFASNLLFHLESATEHLNALADPETGNVAFETSRDVVSVYNEAPGHGAENYVYCSQNREQLTMIDSSFIVLEPGAGEVVCDYYQTPISYRG
jgi:hypothetical protein